MNNFKGVNFRLVKNEIPTAIIYTRVSTKEQVQNFSLVSQEKICQSYAEKNGWEVLKVFREEGESAKTADRTQLQEILQYVAKNKGKVGKMIVYKLNRFARNAEDHFTVKVVLRRYGVELRSATEAISTDASGELMEIVLAGISQFDNRIRAENTIIGMKSRLLDGLWSGKAPWGYYNDKDKKIIIPHSEKALIVKMLFEKYATGKYTFPELAKMANKLGQKSRHGMKISKQLVAKITANPIYYGMVVVPKFKISTKGSHDPIITEQLFRQAQGVRNGIIGRKSPRNKDNQDFPLRGIKCSGCDKSISGGKTKGKTKYYQYYNCVNYKCPKRKSINKDDFENDFTKFLMRLTPDDNFFEALKEAIKIAHKSEFNSITSSERKINMKISELKEKKDKLLDLRMEESISNEDFIPKNESYKIQIVELEQELNNLSIPELGLDSVIDSSIEFLKHLPETWRSLHVKDLRVLRTLLFPKNIFYTYPGISIKTLELCCVYNIKPPINDDENRFVTPRRIGLRFRA